MSLNPLGNPVFRAFDSNGNPLAGGFLYTFAAGTTTPLATYTDSSGSVANTNPVVLDANGEAQVWLTPGVFYYFELGDSNNDNQWTVDNYPSPAAANVSTDEVATDPGGRLTLTSGTPVTTSDVSGAATIYYATYKSDKVPLYDGTAWALYSIGAGLSQTTADNTKSPAAVTLNSNYDLFVWNDSGTVRLSRGPAWTSDTARGTGAGTTELQQVNGRYVNKVSISNGPGAQRGLYVGTVRSDASSQINDSLAKRHVWNTFNRARRALRVADATANWTYTLLAWRQANGAAANQIAFVLGLDEDVVSARASNTGQNSVATNIYAGIGLDATNAVASGCLVGSILNSAGSSAQLTAHWSGNAGLGSHYLAWLESSNAAGITTWVGTSGNIKSGIHGEVMA